MSSTSAPRPALDGHLADPRVLSHPQLREVIQGLRIKAADMFGSCEIGFRLVEAADREASQVFKLSVTGAVDVKGVYVKLYKPKDAGPSGRDSMRARVLHDFEISSRLCGRMASLPRYHVVQPLACFPDQLAVVTVEAEGETLSSVLERRAAWWPSPETIEELGGVLAATGGWVKAFQAVEPPRGRFSLDEMRRYVDVRLRRLLGTDPPQVTAAQRESILRHFDRMAGLVDSSDLAQVLTHSDLAPSNVLVNGPHVTVIDLAMAAPGSVFMDVARLHSQLEFLLGKPKFRPAVIRSLQCRLLQGFDPDLHPDRPLFRLFLMQHLLCHMSNLARNPAPALARLYNRHQLRLHRQWLQLLAA